jgi:hypothetical protein
MGLSLFLPNVIRTFHLYYILDYDCVFGELFRNYEYVSTVFNESTRTPTRSSVPGLANHLKTAWKHLRLNSLCVWNVNVMPIHTYPHLN